MRNKPGSRAFKALDALYLVLAVLPLAFGMALKVLTEPPAAGDCWEEWSIQ